MDHMTLRIRSLLVLIIGTVLGLTVSVGSSLLADRQTAPAVTDDSGALPEQYVEQLAEVIERVRREYVDVVDDQRLIDGAIRGMLEELDTHSRYLDPKQYEDIRISTTGNYTGVGLDVSMENGRVTVVSPIDDAPAAKAGILPGDVVISVDDIAVNAENAAETVNRMRGMPGTEVRLGVVRAGEEGKLSFALTRAPIQVRTVHSAYLGEGIGYMRVTGFSERTAEDMESAASSLMTEGDRLDGLVLDLRNNPGGVLDSAIDVADLFLDSGLIVSGSGRVSHARFEEYASAGEDLEDVPLVVLVNAGSASAAEIVAGAIQDHHRGQLVGDRTYGKGSVQTVVPLKDGRAIKLTTSRYLTPSGRSINGKGIDPDLRVLVDEPGRQYTGPGSLVAAADDLQLQEALRTLASEARPHGHAL